MTDTRPKRVRAIRFQQEIVAAGERRVHRCERCARNAQRAAGNTGFIAFTRAAHSRIPQARNALCAGAQLFGVRGPVCDAAFVIRPGDALALASSAFGGFPTHSGRSPRSNEKCSYARCAALAGSLSPVCGRELLPARTDS